METLLIRDAPSPVGISIQSKFEQTGAVEELLASLPRDAKKALKRTLEEAGSRPVLGSAQCEAVLEAAQRGFETLLAGRVAASLRVLTHELLTPLQGALNDAEEIKSGRTEPVDRLKINLASIHGIAKQVHVLLSENLEPTPQHIRDVTVHNVIHKLCSRLESVAAQKHVALHNTFNSGTKCVSAIPDQLETLFSCLLDNAIKYSFSGSTEKARKVTIRYKDEASFLTVSVHNFGCPILEAEVAERTIFELGYRGECSGDRRRSGTGSGLYIADRIVKAHGGRIEVQSKLSQAGADGANNTFVVWWPKALAQSIA